jgi:putative ABC transport system substrate-binding protein
MRIKRLRRREFITLVGGAAAVWPLAAGGQQPPMPVIGFLHQGPREAFPLRIAFREGLSKAGIIEGRNVTIENRYAEPSGKGLPLPGTPAR